MTIQTPKNVRIRSIAEARQWATNMDCSVAELKIAMRAVGESAEKIRAYLGALQDKQARGTITPVDAEARTSTADNDVLITQLPVDSTQSRH